MRNKTSVFDKKVVTRFDKKNMDMVEKQHWWRQESITLRPEEEYPISLSLSLSCLCGLKEDPITEDPRENPFNDKPKVDHCRKT